MWYSQIFLLDHVLKKTACQCKDKVCHLFQNSPRVRPTNWIPASSHAFPVDGGIVRNSNLPPLERALPYLVDTLYEELDSITRLLAARPPGSLTPPDLEVIGHLIKISSDFRACLQQSAPPGQPGACPDREPAEERPGSRYACDPRMVDPGSYQQTTGHNPLICQAEQGFAASGPPEPLPPRDVTVLLRCPALDSKGKPVVHSHLSQESRTSREHRSAGGLQPKVSRYMIIARRLLTKVSKIVSNHRLH